MPRKVKPYVLLPALAVTLAAADPAIAQEPATIHLWQPRISIVWPHDGQGNPTSAEASRAVNISVWPQNQVSCTEEPEWGLSMAKDNEPLQLVRMRGQLIQRTVDGRTFPTLEFNDIPADLVAEPTAQDRFMLGSRVWVHAADYARTCRIRSSPPALNRTL